MNFFQAQDRARRNTLWLTLLFLGGVAGIILVLYVVLFYGLSATGYYTAADGVAWGSMLRGLSGQEGMQLQQVAFRWDGELLLHVALGVIGFLSLVSAYKVLALSLGGGKRVAETLNGRLLMHSTRKAHERQLLNIVEEMAIAAGAPVPDVYLLPDMQVNAFAAGTTPHNAVIGVTRGAIEHLGRDELQGVIAHEYSHIMNGDMRINIRLIAIIHGMMLIGYIGMTFLRGGMYSSLGHSSRRREGGGGGGLAAMMAFALVLIVLGAIGTFVGSLIRAAVSRQREFLADAAAVQYTRNPQGIAGALDSIWRRHAPISTDARAAEFAHMFFSNAVGKAGFSSMFATHPPLRQRIARILPDWPADEPISKPPVAPPAAEQAGAAPSEGGKDATPLAGAGLAAVAGLAAAGAAASAQGAAAAKAQAQAVTPDEMVQQMGTVTPLALECAYKLMAAVPPALGAATEEPYAARALIYALLLDKEDAAVRAAQLHHLDMHADEGVAALTTGLYPDAADLPPAARLPLAQMALPALHLLSPAQYERFKENMATLIAADESINLFEWCMQAMVVHHLQEYFGEKRRTYGDKMASMEYALSILAQSAQQGDAGSAFTAAARQVRLPVAYIASPFQPRRLFYALQHIAALAPKKKEQFARAAMVCASHDGRIDADEEALLRAYCMMIDCPLPLLAHSDA